MLPASPNPAEHPFHLLRPATEPALASAATIRLGGRAWQLSAPQRLPSDQPGTDAAPYICISYAWGAGRVAHGLHAGQTMSDRTIPAIEATLRAAQVQALWVDALCVPEHDPAQAACLRGMGDIYACAAQVFVVLSARCADLLQQIRSTGRVTPGALFMLETDDWIMRAWTYQESANSKNMQFICEPAEATSATGTTIASLDFLGAVLSASAAYREEHGIDPVTWWRQYPRLDRLENMIADHRIADFAGRSAYQVMSAMVGRTSAHPADHLYAMIGAIAPTPARAPVVLLQAQTVHPAEYLMHVCEAKGDFSFIYSVAPRNRASGRRWRPVGTANSVLAPVLSGLLVNGAGQAGRLNPGHLELDKMCRLERGPVQADAMRAIGYFLQPFGIVSDDIAAAVLLCLRQKGFSGSGDYLELTQGYFFPQTARSAGWDACVFISQELHWPNGGPGLLLQQEASSADVYRFCDVGVFIGSTPQFGVSIKLG